MKYSLSETNYIIKRMLKGIAIAGGIVAFGAFNLEGLSDGQFFNAKERIVGFEKFRQLRGYSIVKKVEIPTRGDITLIKALDGERYVINTDDDGTKTIEGRFYYEIQSFLGPAMPEDADLNTDCYSDVREGAVTFARRQK